MTTPAQQLISAPQIKQWIVYDYGVPMCVFTVEAEAMGFFKHIASNRANRLDQLGTHMVMISHNTRGMCDGTTEYHYDTQHGIYETSTPHSIVPHSIVPHNINPTPSANQHSANQHGVNTNQHNDARKIIRTTTLTDLPATKSPASKLPAIEPQPLSDHRPRKNSLDGDEDTDTTDTDEETYDEHALDLAILACKEKLNKICDPPEPNDIDRPDDAFLKRCAEQEQKIKENQRKSNLSIYTSDKNTYLLIRAKIQANTLKESNLPPLFETKYHMIRFMEQQNLVRFDQSNTLAEYAWYEQLEKVNNGNDTDDHVIDEIDAEYLPMCCKYIDYLNGLVCLPQSDKKLHEYWNENPTIKQALFGTNIGENGDIFDNDVPIDTHDDFFDDAPWSNQKGVSPEAWKAFYEYKKQSQEALRAGTTPPIFNGQNKDA
jgi:hypothetical protein